MTEEPPTEPDPEIQEMWAKAVKKADALVALSESVEKRARFKQAAGAYADSRSRASKTPQQRERAAVNVAKDLGVDVPAASPDTTSPAAADTQTTETNTPKPAALDRSASTKSDRSDASSGGNRVDKSQMSNRPKSQKTPKPAVDNSGDVLGMWDEKGNIRVAKALSDKHTDKNPHEVTLTQDQYKLLYLISRLQSVSFDPPPARRRGLRVELTRNELPNTASAMSRTSSVDSLENAIRVGREEDEKARVEDEKNEVRFTNENRRVVKNILGGGHGGGKVAPAPEGEVEVDAASPRQKSVTISDEMDLGDGDANIVFPAEASAGSSKPRGSSKPALTKQWSTKTMWNTAVKSVVNTLKLRHTLSRSFEHVPSTMRELQDSASTRWVHRTPLLVYIYEGILLDIFDSYDFYPGSEMSGVCKGVLNMNVSTEGVDDLSDLQEMGLLLRLKLGTKDHFTTTSYQVSLL